VATEKPVEIKRRHHYLPCSYLSGFASKDERDGLIWVADSKEHKTYRQTCENVGYKKDYYQIDVPDTKPDAIEDAFAIIEGIGKQAILKIEKDKAIPQGSAYSELMSYLALLFARVPNVREYWNAQIGELKKLEGKARISQQTPQEIFDFFKESDQPFATLKEAEDFRDEILGNDYVVKYDQTTEIRTVVQNADIVAGLLAERFWTVAYRTDNQSNRFVTCDHPVMLFWNVPIEGNHPPGFGLTNTKVYVPLSMNTALFGLFEKKDYLNTRLTNHLIKKHNFLTTLHSDRFVFSFEKGFKFINEKGAELSYES